MLDAPRYFNPPIITGVYVTVSTADVWIQHDKRVFLRKLFSGFHVEYAYVLRRFAILAEINQSSRIKIPLSARKTFSGWQSRAVLIAGCLHTGEALEPSQD